MISDLCKADLPRRSERTSRERPRAFNIPPVTEIDGEIDDGTTATDVSIITMTPTTPLLTKAALRSTTRVTRSTNSLSSQNIRYTWNLRLKRRSTRAKR